jgi:hypothetical protein
VADLNYVLHNNTHYESCWKSLKETSFDEINKVYLCQSDMKVFDFDCIVKTLYPKKQPASYDALLVNEKNKRVYCIEFKNQKPSEIDKSNIQKKLKNGKDILTDLCKQNNVQQSLYTFIYCVVFKKNKGGYREGIKNSTIRFDLEQYKNQYFDEIITNDIVFFIREFQKKFTDETC